MIMTSNYNKIYDSHFRVWLLDFFYDFFTKENSFMIMTSNYNKIYDSHFRVWLLDFFYDFFTKKIVASNHLLRKNFDLNNSR